MPETFVLDAAPKPAYDPRIVLDAGTELLDAAPKDEKPMHHQDGAIALRPQITNVNVSGASAQEERETMRKILLDLKVKPTHVHIALRRNAQTGEPMSQIMADFGFLSGEGVAQAVSMLHNLPLFKAEQQDSVDFTVLKKVKLAKYEKFVPVGRDKNKNLIVAVSDPSMGSVASNSLNEQGERNVKLVIASEHTIQSIYRKHFANTEVAFDEKVQAFMAAAENSSKTRHVANEEGNSGGQVSDVYFAMLRHACYSGASDLYLYQSDKIGILKLKVNGVGQIFRTLDLELYKRLLNKMVQDNSIKPDDLKAKPKESVVEIKGPDAKTYSDLADRFGFRLELTESRGIRNAVIRVLDKNAAATDLNNLGFDDYTEGAINRISQSSTGFFLVTGPTGSGKTTSLYAILKSIDAVERSIQSIENPIEYRHGLWQQYELRKDSTSEAEDYNDWLKALLRNAPDVILVGEVRDRGVAEICLNAANTGHLVFATLHTNDATLAVARLKSLQVDMDVLGSVLLGILAQRLSRVLCDACKVEDTRPETAKELEGATYLGNVAHKPHMAGEGCEACNFTAYRGRRMVYELLEMNAEVRDALEKGSPPSAVAKVGMNKDRTMWASGMRMVATGVTSMEELRRVAKESF